MAKNSFLLRGNTILKIQFELAPSNREIELLIAFLGLPNAIDNPLPLIVIKANFFHPPTPPGGLAYSQNFLGVENLHSQPPHSLIIRDKKSTLSANWTVTLLIHLLCYVVLSLTSLSYV